MRLIVLILFFYLSVSALILPENFLMFLSSLSIFAGMAVIANFFLMVTWLPASVIISERLNVPNISWLSWRSRLAAVLNYCENISKRFDNFLTFAVVRTFCFIFWFHLWDAVV